MLWSPSIVTNAMKAHTAIGTPSWRHSPLLVDGIDLPALGADGLDAIAENAGGRK